MPDLNDVSREIRRAVDTGKVAFGFKQSEKTLLSGKPELIVFCKNIQKPVKERLQEYATIAGVQCFVFEGNGLELGAVCGKPFVVSVLSILDLGKSNVLETMLQEKITASEKTQAKKKPKKERKARVKRVHEKTGAEIDAEIEEEAEKREKQAEIEEEDQQALEK